MAVGAGVGSLVPTIHGILTVATLTILLFVLICPRIFIIVDALASWLPTFACCCCVECAGMGAGAVSVVEESWIFF